MSIYLPRNASKARLRDAERARQNRAEIVRELSWGRVSRRDLLKWGLFSGAGALAMKGGLNPFVSASAQTFGPTGAPPKADISQRRSHYRFVPTRDVCARLTICPLQAEADVYVALGLRARLSCVGGRR